LDSFPRLLRPLVKSVIRRKRGMHGSTMTRALSNTATESYSCTSLDHELRTIVVVACNDNKRRLELLPTTLNHALLREEKRPLRKGTVPASRHSPSPPKDNHLSASSVPNKHRRYQPSGTQKQDLLGKGTKGRRPSANTSLIPRPAPRDCRTFDPPRYHHPRTREEEPHSFPPNSRRSSRGRRDS
jgi:hypothetical protein